MTALSVLDLMMIGENKTFADSLNDSLMLARQAEQSGYRRYWIAEHHNMPGIASSSTTLIMSHLAAGTTSLRIGSGGIMMPNHSPLVVAEQFATLNTLYPGRIDLGVGRAPGTDPLTAQAIRGERAAHRELSDDVRQLLDYLADNGHQPVRSLPGRQDVPVWILGAGMYGADLAASLGLPYAFASHFAPAMLFRAIQHYRTHFRPGPYLTQPYVVAGVNVFAADTAEEAEYLASSHRQWVINRNAGRAGPLPAPVENYLDSIPEFQRRAMQDELECTVTGTSEQVGAWLQWFIQETGADELMIDARIYDPADRCRSFRLTAESFL